MWLKSDIFLCLWLCVILLIYIFVYLEAGSGLAIPKNPYVNILFDQIVEFDFLIMSHSGCLLLFQEGTTAKLLAPYSMEYKCCDPSLTHVFIALTYAHKHEVEVATASEFSLMIRDCEIRRLKSSVIVILTLKSSRK